jgi:hypothetical protein
MRIYMHTLHVPQRENVDCLFPTWKGSRGFLSAEAPCTLQEERYPSRSTAPGLKATPNTTMEAIMTSLRVMHSLHQLDVLCLHSPPPAVVLRALSAPVNGRYCLCPRLERHNQVGG